jgi:hypothetical protein
MGWAGRDDKYKILIGETEGKRLLERPRRRWEDEIEMDFKEAG